MSIVFIACLAAVTASADLVAPGVTGQKLTDKNKSAVSGPQLRECFDGQPDIEWIDDSVRDANAAFRVAKDFHEKHPSRLMGYRRGRAADGAAGEVFKAIERATGYRAASCLAGDAKDAPVRFAAQPKCWQVGATYAENADGSLRRLDFRPPPKRSWTLDWADEFDGDRLDTNRWTACDCWHCAEEQFYTSREKNVRVENGCLVLEAHRERFDTLRTAKDGRNLCGAVPGKSYDSKRRYADFTSGCVVSAGKAAFTGGRIEIRAKIPTGKWSWPALWMMGEDIPRVGWPRCGEVDIMEYWGRSPRSVFGTCHFAAADSPYFYVPKNGCGHVGQGDRLENVDVEEGFHVYAVEWDEDRVEFYFDGTLYYVFPVANAAFGADGNAFHKPMYVLMNYALDPAIGKVPSDFQLPRRLEIDYVRHYRATDDRANRANLAAVDHLGRRLVSQAEAGAVKKGRQVGLFYYLWLGQHGTRGPWDVSKMLEKDPDVFNKPDSPLWPDMSRTPILHWGEPLWGYYLSTDEWVLRRQVEMFIQAGVDVLYFDTTNGYHYREVTDKLFAILQEYHDRGFAAPKFCYYMAPARRGCGTSNVLDVWLNYYKDRKFSDLYFMWEGKPLIVTHPDRSYRQEIWDFFTFRRPTWGCPEKPDTWYWSGMPKQGVAVSSKGVREMLPVTVATPHVAPESPDKENAGWNLGSQEANWRNDMQSRSCRSDLGGRRDTRPNAAHYGIFFQEQIDWALAREREDVPLAFICQWNEWVSPTLTKPTNDMFGRMPHWLIMMDECSMEASRDIEPMKGGYQDAYYLQMMNFIRRWKGLPEPAKATRTYDFAADDLGAWAKVSPSYEEMTGDCAPRNHPGFDNAGVYTNYTGRNEFKLLKVAVLKDAVAFYAETVRALTPESDPRWMELFVKVPGQKTDAMGYTHRIDRATKGVTCTHRGNRLVYVVPAKLLGVDIAKPFQLEFKWSDNRQSDDVMDFYVNGDAAPRGRLNWLFIRDN